MTKEEAVRRFGSVRALAKALGISTQAVAQWGEDVPPLRVYQIREILSARKNSERAGSPPKRLTGAK
jgi:DNA-binding transcriptional regulator YdaS (Cro superfamily)